MAKRYLRDFERGCHSVYLLYYHFCCVTKYRRKVITADVAEIIKSVCVDIGSRFDVRLNEFNGEPDHIHCLLQAAPDSQMSKFIGQFKGRSSYEILRAFPDMKEKIGREGVFWSPSYCLLTTGGAPIDIIKKYIESQEGFEFENAFKKMEGSK